MCVPWCCSKMSIANPEAALGLETETQKLHHQRAACDIKLLLFCVPSGGGNKLQEWQIATTA